MLVSLRSKIRSGERMLAQARVTALGVWSRKRSGTALGVLRLASVEPLRVFRGRGARAG